MFHFFRLENGFIKQFTQKIWIPPTGQNTIFCMGLWGNWGGGIIWVAEVKPCENMIWDDVIWGEQYLGDIYLGGLPQWSCNPHGTRMVVLCGQRNSILRKNLGKNPSANKAFQFSFSVADCMTEPFFTAIVAALVSSATTAGPRNTQRYPMPGFTGFTVAWGNPSKGWGAIIFWCLNRPKRVFKGCSFGQRCTKKMPQIKI